MQLIRPLLPHLFSLAAIALLAYLVGNILPMSRGAGYNILSSFPVGSDTPSHVSKIMYLKQYGPLGWYYKEGMGYPYLLYPPLSYYLAYFLSILLPLDILRLTNVIAFAAIVLSAWGIYWFAEKRFGDILMAFAASSVYLASWSAWFWQLGYGLWAQTVATPMAVLMFPTFWLWMKSGRRIWLAGTTALFAGCIATHTAVAVVGALGLFLYILSERVTGEFDWKTLKGFLGVIFGGAGLSIFWALPFLNFYPMSGYVFTNREPIGPIEWIVFYLGELPDVAGVTLIPARLGATLVPIAAGGLFPSLLMYSFIGAGVIWALHRMRKGVRTLPLAILLVFLPFSSLLLDYLFFQDFVGDYLNAILRFNFLNTMMVGILAGFGVAAIRRILLKMFKGLASTRIKVVLTVLLCMLILSSSYWFASSALMRAMSLDTHQGQYGLAQDIAKIIGGSTLYRYDVSPRLGDIKLLLPIVTDTPQAGLYFGQGSVIGGWDGYKDAVLYGPLGGPEEVKIVLRWFGIRYIILHHDLDPIWKYRGSAFHEVFNESNALVFEYVDSTNLFSASSVRTILVIGSEERDAYATVLRAVIAAGIDPEGAVLIKGSGYVDDYTLSELDGFDVLILQGYGYHDHDRAWQLLDEYVAKGGNLFLETGWQFVSQDWQSTSIPAPAPVTRTTWSTFEKQWDFSYSNTSLTEGVNFTRFPPPVYENVPAGFSVASSGDLQDWAKPVLVSWGHTLVVAGQYGEGRVIWSGMNLIASSLDATKDNNYEESKFLSNLLGWLNNATKKQTVDNKLLSWKPQELVLQVSGNSSTGVLLRQAFFPNWRAFVEIGSQRQDVKIYRAGPSLMYVRVPVMRELPVKIILIYELSTLESASMLLSVLSLAALGLWIWKGTPPVGRMLNPLKRKVRRIWQEEE